mmetsp:Transcript_8543/g.14983  ORF Transcript_8543/g.14983 Transcript_8543/m.14983 type:complete len:301 (-) Transcript_8543:155-1057(-)
MENLLDDIPPLIAGYLPPLDAIDLSRTCRKLQSQLSLTATPRRRILTGFIRHDSNDDRHYGFQIPIISQVAVHSILVSMTWKDQGWGNRKGRVFVVAGGGRVVYSSGIAPHNLEQFSFTFEPRQNESYHLWYNVGGGGGHSLRLSNVSVQALVFDDPSGCFGKAHIFLGKTNTFHPWDVMGSSHVHQFHHDTFNTILASTSHALTHGLQVLPPMISFFAVYGISEADLSLALIASIESVRNDWKQESSTYANAMPTDAPQVPLIHHVDNDLEDFFGREDLIPPPPPPRRHIFHRVRFGRR